MRGGIELLPGAVVVTVRDAFAPPKACGAFCFESAVFRVIYFGGDDRCERADPTGFATTTTSGCIKGSTARCPRIASSARTRPCGRRQKKNSVTGLTRDRQVCIVLGMRRKKETSEARQRILETADRLFYQEGVRAVGIDRIIAEADVAKMSLYNHFPSKDDLILAVLKYREESVLGFFRSAMERHGKKAKSPLRVFFSALKDFLESPGFRGCPFQNAVVELADPAHPGTEFVRGHKQRFSEFLRGLVDETVGKAGTKVAAAVTILVEGAIVTAVIQGKPDAADVARDAAMKLVAMEKGGA
jgi:AcrR family transcriptional regulator